MDTKKLCTRFNKIKSTRAPIESHWQDLSKYFLPTRYGTLVKQVPGQKFDTDIYDTTGMHSLQIAASGIHGYLTNPSDRWFALNVEGDTDGEGDAWLHTVEERMFQAINKSNFNEQIHELYLDLICFGTGAFYVQESDSPDYDALFYTRPISEIFISESEEKVVDTVFRLTELTARQARQRWGKDAGETVQHLLDANKPDDMVEFLHVVMPREEREQGKKDKLNMPFASIWIDYKKKNKISEGGYREFPFMVPRYSKTAGHDYGYSPCMISLPEQKMLSKMSETTLKAAQKLVDPPIVLPDDGYLLPLDTTPGAVNFKNPSLQGEMDVLQIPHQLPIGLEMEENRRQMIRTQLFTDLFLMLSSLRDKQMTATEVNERVSERLIVLAPVLGRLSKELLKPTLERLFNIMLRNNRVPKPPASLQGRGTEIEFISPLAQAQKSAKVGTIQQMLMTIMNAAQALPDILDMVDIDKVGEEMGKVYNLQHLLRSDAEVRKIREQRQQQMQQAQMMESAERMAKTGKDVAEAESKLQQDATRGE